MNRRNFIKVSMCAGCAASLAPVCKPYVMSKLPSNLLADNKFIYKSKDDMPKTIRIDSCTLCQLNCERCWIRANEKQIEKTEGFGYLKFEDFKNLVDDNPQIKEIELSNSGEMFLNPELAKIIKYANEKNVELTAYTGVNLNNLSEEMAEAVVKYKFKHIFVSIDGATPETYAIYRRGGNLENVFTNIKKINKYKKMYKSDFPILTYKFIIFGHNEHEIELAKQKANELNMIMKFVPNDAIGYSPIKNQEYVTKHTGLGKYSMDAHKEDLKNKKEDSPQGPYVCTLLVNQPQINWNGNLLGCCAINDKNFGVNVFKVGLMKALNHRNFVEAKKMLTNLSYETKAKIPCVGCNFYEFMKEVNAPIKV